MLECIYYSYTRYSFSGPKGGLKGSWRVVTHLKEESGPSPKKVLWNKGLQKRCAKIKFTAVVTGMFISAIGSGNYHNIPSVPRKTKQSSLVTAFIPFQNNTESTTFLLPWLKELSQRVAVSGTEPSW